MFTPLQTAIFKPILITAVLLIGFLTGGSTPKVPITVGTLVVGDYSDIVTQGDLGFDDRGGNHGTLNKGGKPYGTTALVCASGNDCALKFNWNFRVNAKDPEAFTGLFYSLFGLTSTQATYDGPTVRTVAFPEHSLDLNRIDGPIAEPGGDRKLQKLRLALTYQGKQPLTLRVELKDTQGGGRFWRFPIVGSAKKQTLTWNFRKSKFFHILNGQNLNLHKVKELNFVVERKHAVDGVTNRPRGSFRLSKLWFTTNRAQVEPATDAELLDLVERRACQYFVDWSSLKKDGWKDGINGTGDSHTGSYGMPQDRSTFGDLLSVGGAGFALPAYITCAERGWITRALATERVLAILRLLGNVDSFGDEPVGRIGYRGWFYHFFGLDGKRKLNFDFPSTPADESLNTVELSTIDTGLAVMGVLAAQGYFDKDTLEETEIRTLAQSIYDRVEWDFMLEPASKQFYLAWKPNEPRDGAPYEIPDAGGDGSYSGVPANPDTLDYYTDEAFIVTLLAAGSTTHPVPLATQCAWVRARDNTELIRTYPGALFTYEFLHAFIDARTLNLPACPGEEAVDWYENSRKALFGAIAYAEQNPKGYQTYGADAWGLSAAEGPYDLYHAYGAPPLALQPCTNVPPVPIQAETCPEEDGTVTYYGMLSAVSYGDDLRTRAIQAVRAAWQRNHWDYRFGLPDAFHDESSQVPTTSAYRPAGAPLRTTGPWVGRALFAIDEGPMLMHLENARSGLIWNLLGGNANIQRALTRLRVPLQIKLEGEDGTGDGTVQPRSNASGDQTIWLHAGETRTLSLSFTGQGQYDVRVTYSNDNSGPLESVAVSMDGNSIGQFDAQDTGDSGNGWNVFQTTGTIGSASLDTGTHELELTVSGGDGYGVEVDMVELNHD